MSVAPTRTCVGCGVRAARSELVRVVAVEGEIVPDVAQRLPGRGAYLHLRLACLDRAQRRRAFPRALRLPAALPDGKVAEYLTDSAACSQTV
ncbi:MAG TPA: YlxR family protein [Streptosporangiaceae bacterium]|nr:YlxR family protein [Streptosporangiaceae bacterium]